MPVIIDKLPLNAIALLYIFKLFPGAKIITALRDPRDCVFSCYQQRFGMNQAMFQFLDLKSAAAYYDQAMNVVVKIRDADALFDYQATAKSRHISTPSASRVIQPLYTTSIGKWKHYQEWIGTSFEPLDKWVEEWGYKKAPE